MTELGDALKARAVTGALFAEVMLDEGPQRAASIKGTYTDPQARTWTGVAGVGRISPVKTSEGVNATAFTMGFDVSRREGNEEAFEDLAVAMLADRSTAVRGRRVHAYIGVFHPVTGALIGGNLVPWASGIGSHLAVSWAPTALAMTLHCEPLIGGIWPSKGRYLTHDDQQLLFTGDVGLEFISIIAAGGRNVVWNPGV